MCLVSHALCCCTETCVAHATLMYAHAPALHTFLTTVSFHLVHMLLTLLAFACHHCVSCWPVLVHLRLPPTPVVLLVTSCC